MTIPWLEKIYGWGRDALPLEWRRAIRRRIAVERLFGIRKPVFDATLPPSLREDRPGRPDFIFLAHGEGNFRRQRPQQLVSALAKTGGRVFFAELGAEEPRSPEPGVVLLATPGARREDLYDRALGGEGLSRAVAAMRSAAERFSILHAVLVVELPYWRSLAEALRAELGWKVVYDCIDDHSAFSTVRRETAELEESGLVRGADLVVASSAKLVEKMSSLGVAARLIRNAADFEFFSRGAARSRGPRPRIGYFGAVSEWFDLDLLAAIAKRRSEWDFEIVGSTFGSKAGELRLPNVAFEGEVPYAELDRRLAGFDACIIPFRLGPLTEATNPVKVYEMLASGKPVVATPIPELVPLADDGLVRLASKDSEFERMLAEAISEDDPALRARRTAYARANDWGSRAEDFRSAARSLYPCASVIVVTFDNLDFNRACLSSLLSETDWPNLELIFVDNGSTDGTKAWLLERQARTPELRAVINDVNLGFAPAVNRGVGASTGEFLCLLNNDTVVTRGWLPALLGHLERDLRLGIVGASTNEISNEARVPVSYSSLSELREWAKEFTAGNRGRRIPIPMVAMFCSALRRSLYDSVGPLDERFSVGMFEDDDYSRRVIDAGFTLACARDSFVHHRGRGSFEKLGEERYLAIYRENERRYREKWGLPARSAAAPTASSDDLPERLVAEEGVIVFPPSIGWAITLVQRPHYMARYLAKAGAIVVYDCTVPGGRDDDFTGFREVEPGVFLFRGPARQLRPLRRPWLWSYPYNVPSVDDWADARLAYDIIDDLGVFPYPEKFLRRNHERAMKTARCVFAVSAPLLEEARGSRPDAVYLPNAVENERFRNVDVSLAPAALRRLRGKGRPIAGYVGSLSKWRDLSLLERVAPGSPGWEFVLIGVSLDRAWETSRLSEIGNVHFLGPIPHEAVPAAISLFDVALEPFPATREMRASSPLKLYEYLAAGRPIVSSPIPEMEAVPEVLIARDAADWNRALVRALDQSRDAAFTARLRAVALRNDWSARARQALDLLYSKQ